MLRSLWMLRQQNIPPFRSSPCSGLSFSPSSASLSLTSHSYSTPFEITIDVIGIFCAIAAGAAQVSLISNMKDIAADV
jgi:hypothetical protein